MSEYTHRLVVIVPIAQQDQANQTAATWDPGGGGSDTFGALRLSSSGQEPATHLACNTLCKDDLFNAAPGLSPLVFRAYDVVNGALLAEGGSSWQAYACAGWSADQCFADAGLQPIAGPLSAR